MFVLSHIIIQRVLSKPESRSTMGYDLTQQPFSKSLVRLSVVRRSGFPTILYCNINAVCVWIVVLQYQTINEATKDTSRKRVSNILHTQPCKPFPLKRRFKLPKCDLHILFRSMRIPPVPTRIEPHRPHVIFMALLHPIPGRTRCRIKPVRPPQCHLVGSGGGPRVGVW